MILSDFSYCYSYKTNLGDYLIDLLKNFFPEFTAFDVIYKSGFNCSLSAYNTNLAG